MIEVLALLTIVGLVDLARRRVVLAIAKRIATPAQYAAFVRTFDYEREYP